MKITTIPFLICCLMFIIACGNEKGSEPVPPQREEIPEGEDETPDPSINTVKCFRPIQGSELVVTSQIRQTDSKNHYYDCSVKCRWQLSLISFIDAAEHEPLTCLGENTDPQAWRACTSDVIDTRESDYGPLIHLKGSQGTESFDLWCEEKVLEILYLH